MTDSNKAKMFTRTDLGKSITVARILKAVRSLVCGTSEIDVGFRDTEIRSDNVCTATWNERCWARDEDGDWATDLADIRSLGEFTREIRKVFVNGTDVSLDLYCYGRAFGERELLENVELRADGRGVRVSKVTFSGLEVSATV